MSSTARGSVIKRGGTWSVRIDDCGEQKEVRNRLPIELPEVS